MALNGVLAVIAQLKSQGVSDDAILTEAVKQTSLNSDLYKTLVAHLGAS